MPLAYAHLVSIHNLSRLVGRLSQRLLEQAQEAAAPASVKDEALVEV